MNEIGLSPCTFCGGEAAIHHFSVGLHQNYSCVRCTKCKARGADVLVMQEGDEIAVDCEAALRWNTRYLIEYTVKIESEEPRTNGDIIRKMSDDDLGFWKARPVCESCAWFENRECDEDCTKYNCFNGAIAWLKKEVSEDAGSKTD